MCFRCNILLYNRSILCAYLHIAPVLCMHNVRLNVASLSIDSWSLEFYHGFLDAQVAPPVFTDFGDGLPCSTHASPLGCLSGSLSDPRVPGPVTEWQRNTGK